MLGFTTQLVLALTVPAAKSAPPATDAGLLYPPLTNASTDV